jgi:predicted RNA-binding protein with PUA-like domain
VRHWILQCNPNKWRIFDFYADGQELTSWSVTHHLDELRLGDNFAIWLTGVGGGAAAVGEVTGQPEAATGADADDPYYADVPDPSIRRWALPIQVTRRFLDDPVNRDDLRADPGFARSAIITRPWASNPFPVTDVEWQVVVRRSAGRSVATGGYSPAEAFTSATDLLRRLIGRPLQTVTGRTNTVLNVEPPTVLVATGRSTCADRVCRRGAQPCLDPLKSNFL